MSGKKEVKKAVTIVLQPSIKKMADKLAKRHKVSLSELIAQAMLRAEHESDFLSECVESGDMSKADADSKFKSDWGIS